MRCLLPIFLATAFSQAPSPAFSAAPNSLEPLSFLLGEWVAEGKGKPGGANGTSTFTLGLQDRVILRTSYAEYPSSPGKPSLRHDDLMVIYVTAAGDLRADYYDNEGHVIRYRITVPANRQAVFLSEAEPKTPCYRLTYTLTPGGWLEGRFDIAPPGKPESFSQYLTWTARRKTS